MLVAGRERPYLQAFFGARVADPSAITGADPDVYVAAYSAPERCARASSCAEALLGFLG